MRHLVIITPTVAVAAYAWRFRTKPGVIPFVLLSVAVSIWSLGYLLELTSTARGPRPATGLTSQSASNDAAPVLSMA